MCLAQGPAELFLNQLSAEHIPYMSAKFTQRRCLENKQVVDDVDVILK